jgi:hypothetical protein
LFYIAFDVIATLFNWRDGTAHWCHLGGFDCGAILALVLLLTRKVNMLGGCHFGLARKTRMETAWNPGAKLRGSLEPLTLPTESHVIYSAFGQKRG